MHGRRFSYSLLAGAVLLGLGLLALGEARLVGQEQLSSLQELKVPFDRNRPLITKFIYGEQKPTAADNQLIDVVARWYVHRLTFLGARNSPKEMEGYVNEFRGDLIDKIVSASAKNNRDFVEKLGPALVKATQPVFKEDLLNGENRLVQVNVANLLPHMARLKQDDIGDYLADLVRDTSKHDAVRVHALKGLKEFLPAAPYTDKDANIKPRDERKDRDVKRVEVLVDFVEGKLPSKSGSHEAPVIHYLRREALESLSPIGVPVVAMEGKRVKKTEGIVAPTLLKVLTKKGFQPEPELGEKIEAAVGLCSMKYSDMPEYRPDLAIYLVGRFLVEFAGAYNIDYANVAAKAPNRLKQPWHMWKLQAKRLELGIKDLAANAKPSPILAGKDAEAAAKTQKNAQELEKLAVPVLQAIYRSEQVSAPPNARATIESLRPANKAVFRNSKDEIELD